MNNGEASYTTRKFFTAEEIADATGGITADRLRSMANANWAPHYIVDGKGPFFKKGEIFRWIEENIVQQVNGRRLPIQFKLSVDPPLARGELPKQLRNISGLRIMPKWEYGPAVYFLCTGQDVVYVGSSTNPATRISGHISEATKEFESVYLLPVSLVDLRAMEEAFIGALKPKYNSKIPRNKSFFSVGDMTPDELLAAYRADVETQNN